MEVFVAKYAGFCFGVKRAVDLAITELDKKTPLYSIGKIVHNKSVNDKLISMGLNIVDNIKDVPDNNRVIIRAHGVTQSEIELCKSKSLSILDTTCPNVSRIHKIVQEYSNKGYHIIILGDKFHPEVIGITGWAGDNVRVINDIKEAKDFKSLDKACVVSQTTMDLDKNSVLVEILKNNVENLIVFDTICLATKQRQEELKNIAKKVDYMIVIGDRLSANSNRLYDISKGICKNTQFIENISELCLNFYTASCKIGVTAGASTPDWVINEVLERVYTINKSEGMEILSE